MFRLRTDEDVHVDVIDGGVVRVRRMTRNELRWEHAIELVHLYADRFGNPIADPIDGWFDDSGALRLIVHVRDIARPRLLPPRELTFAADGPLLERSRPGADRHTLQSPPLRTHVHGGLTYAIACELDDHVLVVTDADRGRQLGWSIADQPPVGFRWMERGELGNLARPTGACGCNEIGRFAAAHLPNMNPIAVDRERGETRRTVECNRCLTSWQIVEVREPGTLEVLWKWTRLGSRSPAALAEAAPTIAVQNRSTRSMTDRPLITATLVRGRVTVDGIDHDEGFEVFYESPDLIELYLNSGATPRPELAEAGWQWSNAGAYTYHQTFEKTDPRLGGFVGLAEHRGYKLRLTERRPDEVHVLACRSLARLLGLREDEVTAYGWVADREAPHRPLLDDELVRGLPAFASVMYAPLARTFQVVAETATTLTLWSVSRDVQDDALVAAGFRTESEAVQAEYDLVYNYNHTLEVSKLDGRVPGPFSRLVRYGDFVLRVIAEREGHVLAIAHPMLGRTLDFAELLGAAAQSCRWLPITDVEPVSTPTIPPTP